jgi:hypothetical protein
MPTPLARPTIARTLRQCADQRTQSGTSADRSIGKEARYLGPYPRAAPGRAPPLRKKERPDRRSQHVSFDCISQPTASAALPRFAHPSLRRPSMRRRLVPGDGHAHGYRLIHGRSATAPELPASRTSPPGPQPHVIQQHAPSGGRSLYDWLPAVCAGRRRVSPVLSISGVRGRLLDQPRQQRPVATAHLSEKCSSRMPQRTHGDPPPEGPLTRAYATAPGTAPSATVLQRLAGAARWLTTPLLPDVVLPSCLGCCHTRDGRCCS